MSGDPADEPGLPARDSVRTDPSRRRRGLRVPIADVPHASALEEGTKSNGDDHRYEPTPFPQWELPSGVTSAPEGVFARGDATEPTIRLEGEPDSNALEQAEMQPARFSIPVEEVGYSSPPSAPEYDAFELGSTEHPEDFDELEEQLNDIRFSEPPEELLLDDADVVSRKEIEDKNGGAERDSQVQIPIPKPPPPPLESAEASSVEEGDPQPKWYEDFFGEHYLRTVRTPTPKEVAAECDFIERAMRVPVGARVLDVGCGLGLQTVEMAARGYQMVGLDISATMISRAYDEAEDRGLEVAFVRGDMREVTFEQPFDALMCWGTSFGYFDEDGNEVLVRKFHQALRPQGVLFLEVVNRDFIIGSQPNQVWFEVDGSVCMEETDFEYETSRLRVKRRVASQDGRERDREYSIRLYALHEIRSLLERNGFRVVEVSGREATLGVFFGVHSPKMVIRAERVPGPFAEDTSPPPVPGAENGRRPSSLVVPATPPKDDD